MTNREFYEAVAKAEISEELTNFALAGIEKLDKRNEKRSSKPSKTALANEPIKNAIVDEVLTNNPMTAADIGLALEISTQKASALCKQLVTEEKVSVTDIKVKGKGNVKGYLIA